MKKTCFEISLKSDLNYFLPFFLDKISFFFEIVC